jgi:hypothetical protein
VFWLSHYGLERLLLKSQMETTPTAPFIVFVACLRSLSVCFQPSARSSTLKGVMLFCAHISEKALSMVVITVASALFLFDT